MLLKAVIFFVQIFFTFLDCPYKNISEPTNPKYIFVFFRPRGYNSISAKNPKQIGLLLSPFGLYPWKNPVKLELYIGENPSHGQREDTWGVYYT